MRINDQLRIVFNFDRGEATKVLKTTPEFWLNAQMAVDLWQAQAELKDERHSRRKSA